MRAGTLKFQRRPVTLRVGGTYVATRKVVLKYPENLIKEPLLFRMVRRFDVMPNIRRARVTDTDGEMTVELEGTPENLEAGLAFLQEQGVIVEPLAGDIVSP
jgi:ABC-type methionine transport system ATPase subunit